MSYTTKSAKANPVLKLNFPLWIVAASFAIIFILAFTEKSNSPLSGIMMFIVIYRLILTFPFSEHLITKSDNINNVQHDFDLRLSQNHKEEDTIEDDPMDYYSRRKELELTLIRFEALRMQQIERREAAPYTGDLVDCMIEEEQLILY